MNLKVLLHIAWNRRSFHFFFGEDFYDLYGTKILVEKLVKKPQTVLDSLNDLSYGFVISQKFTTTSARHNVSMS